MIKQMLMACVGCGLIVANGNAQTRDDSLGGQVKGLYSGIREHKLANGLRVVFLPMRASSTVTMMVTYKVGSCDEDKATTGLSHYLEHLMFKGTDRLVPGDIDRATLKNGGSNNAWTNEDLTCYHFDFAADRWETALKIEADRMANLRIDAKHEFEQEKGAVIEELKRNEDQPWELESKALLPILFGPKSPYGHPVIGMEAHVRGATASVILDYYKRWYHPNNALVVVAGAINPDEALAKIEKALGGIPAGPLPERKATAPFPNLPVRKTIPSKFEVPRILTGFPTVVVDDADEAPLDLLSLVLAGGKTGRLYRRMVEDEAIATEVGASHSPGRYPGWFSIQVELLADKPVEKAEAILREEIEKIVLKGIEESELKRVIRSMLAGKILGSEKVHNRCQSISVALAQGGLKRLMEEPDRISAVTRADITRVAAKYLGADRAATVISLPAKTPKAAPSSNEEKPARLSRRVDSTPAPGVFDPFVGTKKVFLKNGLEVWLLSKPGLPLLVAQAELKHFGWLQPLDKGGIALLTGSVLDEGAAGKTGRQIAQTIEDMGATMQFGPGGGSLQVLSSDAAKALELFLSCLAKPDFPADAIEREKARMLSALEDQASQPQEQARLALRRAIYGDLPKGRNPLGTADSIKALDVATLKAYHKIPYSPHNIRLAVVGDFETSAMQSLLEGLTKDWTGPMSPKITPKDPVMKDNTLPMYLSFPEAVQLQFYLAHVGIKRSNPDYAALLVMDHVLGTGPGFTDRLSARLRDREGLAYTVNASISMSADNETGMFAAYIGTSPKNLKRVNEEMREEIARIRETVATKDEVEDAKSYILGSMPFAYETASGLAGKLLALARNQLPLDTPGRLRAEVAKITPEEVLRVAKKHLHPDALILIAAGPLDSTGKLLKAPK